MAMRTNMLLRLVVLVCVGTVSNSAANVLLWNANSRQLDRINAERSRNVARSCVQSSGQNRAIIAFLVERRAPAGTVRDARRFFPVLSRAQCARTAAEQVSP